jgi:DNA-directed RNA polymerase subunit RPC12/RpoP
MSTASDPLGPLEPVGDPAGPRTENERLQDGVNRCPKCGSTDIRPQPGTDMLLCLFCRATWSEARVEERFGLGEGIGELQGVQLATGARDIDPATSGVMTLKCSGCGAEVVVNTATELSARCHWCRHVLTINEQMPNGAVPDAVLPFRLTRDEAVERIRRFAGSRRLFAHTRFKAEFVPENVVGVYLPYMVVDANAAADVAGVGEVETRRYTRGSGNDKKTYYDADVFRVRRHVEFTVDDLTVESSAARADMASQTSTNNIVNSILPFDTKNAVSWNADYLNGYTSERRDVDVDALLPHVQDDLLSIARSQVLPTLERYDRGVRWEQERLDLHGSRWVSMYLPVWLYSYFHREGGTGVVHYIAVNARTGETMGSVPLAKGKLLLASLLGGTVVEIIALVVMVGLA